MANELAPIFCERCGAPVPLAPKSPTRCAHCDASVDLPIGHVELLARTLRGQEQLKAADEFWGSMPRPMPSNMARVFVVGVVAMVFAFVLLWAFVFLHSVGGPGRGFALFAFNPSLLGGYLGLEMLAFWSPYARLESSLSATCDPRFPEVALCRHCGAPLSVTRESIFTRCPYCGTDNLVRVLRPQAVQKAQAIATQGRAELDAAIANLQMLRMQRSVVRWVGVPITLGLMALMTTALWNR